jgi:uncharacterized lipoprotein NlpE involved in copper resistance
MNKSMILSATAIWGALALVGCESMTGSEETSVMHSTLAAAAPTTGPANQATFEAAMAAAKAAQKKAASVDGEWRDIGKMLKEAQAEADNGNFEAAIELANEAKFQGVMGYEQAMAQKNVGNPPYLTQ